MDRDRAEKGEAMAALKQQAVQTPDKDSMPKLTHWTGPTKPSERLAYFQEFRELIESGAAKLIRDFGPARLYEADGLIFAVTDTEAVYFVRFSTKDRFGKTFLNQDEVWRGPADAEVVSLQLPRWVFLNVLLPKTGRIVTDEEHTDSGKRFWEARVMDALRAEKRVSFLDWGTGSTHELASVDEIPNWIWGHEQKHRDFRLLIEGR